jgi:hypothetical protein
MDRALRSPRGRTADAGRGRGLAARAAATARACAGTGRAASGGGPEGALGAGVAWARWEAEGAAPPPSFPRLPLVSLRRAAAEGVPPRVVDPVWRLRDGGTAQWCGSPRTHNMPRRAKPVTAAARTSSCPVPVHQSLVRAIVGRRPAELSGPSLPRVRSRAAGAVASRTRPLAPALVALIPCESGAPASSGRVSRDFDGAEGTVTTSRTHPRTASHHWGAPDGPAAWP